MKRTQIYLPENLHRKLKQLAVREQTTVSYIIRKAAEEHIKDKTKTPQKDMLDFLLDIGRKYKGKDKAPKDLSKRHTHYYVEDALKNHG